MLAGEDVVVGDDGPTCELSLLCHHHIPGDKTTIYHGYFVYEYHAIHTTGIL